MATIRVSVPKNQWTQITTAKDGSFFHVSGAGVIVYTEASALPTVFDDATPVMAKTSAGEGKQFYSIASSDSIYAYAISDDCEVTVSPVGV